MTIVRLATLLIAKPSTGERPPAPVTFQAGRNQNPSSGVYSKVRRFLTNGVVCMSVIEATELRKEYTSLRGSDVVAVDGLNLEVTGPGVHGFLGPNGSGKTTTIRCLLGLVKPTGGQIRVLGEDVSNLHEVIHRIGALVETPKFSTTSPVARI